MIDVFGRTANRRQRADGGFSLVEALVAATLMLVVTGAAMAIASRQVQMAQVQPAMADGQQRARVAADSLVVHLREAGAGLESGPLAGGLSQFFAAVIPRRLGPLRPDPYTVVRDDVVTVYGVASERRQTGLREALGADGRLVTEQAPACPPFELLCGLRPGATVLVFDDTGRFDLFALLSVDAAAGLLEPLQSAQVGPYPPGSAVAEVTPHTYYFDEAARQLRHYDGRSTDVPVVDDVVQVVFQYRGDPVPPVRPKPPQGTSNCLYDAAGDAIGGLSVLASDRAALVELPLSLFADGPWCGSGDNRYDADLLRVRQVRAMIRVQAVPDALRGSGADYLNAGTSRSALRSLPDYALPIAVAPRPLMAGR